MKKGLLLVCFLICVTFFSGCEIVNYTQEQRNSTTAEERSVEISTIILNAIKEQDNQTIVDLFCDKAKPTYDLTSELEELFSVIDGKIISYGNINVNKDS